MGTFINLDIDKPVHWKFLLMHILYSILWLLGIGVIIFRGDYFLLDILDANNQWIIKIVPLAYFAIILIIMIISKWYYNLVLLTYPLLQLVWFLPKLILSNGKIYLLSGYLNSIFLRIKRIKSTVIHVILTMTAFLLLLFTDSNPVRIIGILYFTYFYIKIVSKYIKQSLRPPQLFGMSVEDSLDGLIKSPETSYKFIQSIEENKSDEKLSDDEKQAKRVERLLIINSVLEYLGTSLSGFKGKRAFVISWIYQLAGFIVLTLSYYTFMNCELFAINPLNFAVTIEPNVFDFFYYTVKTITFSNIEAIVPVSITARIIEIASFLMVGVLILVIVTSIIFSMKQDKIGDNIQKATEVCLAQNEFISNHIKQKYQVEISTVMAEAGSIKESIDNIKRIIRKIL